MITIISKIHTCWVPSAARKEEKRFYNHTHTENPPAGRECVTVKANVKKLNHMKSVQFKRRKGSNTPLSGIGTKEYKQKKKGGIYFP